MSLESSFEPPPPPVPPTGHGLLADKVVIVTAAAGTGIGSATARRCLEEGASVVLSDAHGRRLAETAEELRAETGGPVHAIACDVTDEAQVGALYAGAISRFGHFDVAVHNAGLGGTVPLVEMSDAQWSTVLDITLTGTFRCTRAALGHLLPQGGGAIVNNDVDGRSVAGDQRAVANLDEIAGAAPFQQRVLVAGRDQRSAAHDSIIVLGLFDGHGAFAIKRCSEGGCELLWHVLDDHDARRIGRQSHQHVSEGCCSTSRRTDHGHLFRCLDHRSVGRFRQHHVGAQLPCHML